MAAGGAELFPMSENIKRFAITGGIACGKSTVAAWLPRWGGCVLDADAVVHALEAPGGAAVDPIRDAFGPGVVQAGGAVDRVALGRRVFRDPAALALLNSLVHPLVRPRIEAWLAEPVAPGVRFRAVVIPLLFETSWSTAGWDAVVAIVCDEAEQIRRLRGRGMSAAEARQRLAAQMSCAEKARRADYAIWNNGTVEALQEAVERLFQALLEKNT
jgi:dephospho-CoA kinase